MRKVKIIVGILMLTMISNVNAQDENNKWMIGFGINAVDFNNVGFSDFGSMVKDYLGPNDWNVLPAISTVSVSRYTNYGLSVRLSGSLNKIDKGVGKDVSGLSFFSLNAAAVYDLNSLFGETAWFDPYVSLGLGGAWVDDNSGFQVEPGLGFNTWFNDTVGLTFSSVYSIGVAGGFVEQVDANSYFQHSVGLAIRFGGSDSDGDGVYDKKDACPNEAGLKEFNGCPDTDGDGIVDADDLCPNAAGTKENRGCPDSDGDGVVDADDLCPEAAGTKENGGCPDSDGDGIVDSKDNCPNDVGVLENNGCPWPDTDGDGVLDKDDKCPDVAGTIEKEGCPELTQEQVKKLGEFSKKIEFNSGKSTFKPGVGESLDKLAEKMLEYSTTNFVIHGYTDNTGSKDKNLEVSKARAKAVKDRLVKGGVDANRLKSEGFGIANPIATNKTSKGRAANRRVEIIAQ